MKCHPVNSNKTEKNGLYQKLFSTPKRRIACALAAVAAIGTAFALTRNPSQGSFNPKILDRLKLPSPIEHCPLRFQQKELKTEGDVISCLKKELNRQDFSCFTQHHSYKTVINTRDNFIDNINDLKKRMNKHISNLKPFIDLQEKFESYNDNITISLNTKNCSSDSSPVDVRKGDIKTYSEYSLTPELHTLFPEQNKPIIPSTTIEGLIDQLNNLPRCAVTKNQIENKQKDLISLKSELDNLKIKRHDLIIETIKSQYFNNGYSSHVTNRLESAKHCLSEKYNDLKAAAPILFNIENSLQTLEEYKYIPALPGTGILVEYSNI